MQSSKLKRQDLLLHCRGSVLEMHSQGFEVVRGSYRECLITKRILDN